MIVLVKYETDSIKAKTMEKSKIYLCILLKQPSKDHSTVFFFFFSRRHYTPKIGHTEKSWEIESPPNDYREWTQPYKNYLPMQCSKIMHLLPTEIGTWNEQATNFQTQGGSLVVRRAVIYT